MLQKRRVLLEFAPSIAPTARGGARFKVTSSALAPWRPLGRKRLRRCGRSGPCPTRLDQADASTEEKSIEEKSEELTLAGSFQEPLQRLNRHNTKVEQA